MLTDAQDSKQEVMMLTPNDIIIENREKEKKEDDTEVDVNDEMANSIICKLGRQFRQSLLSQGSNNALRPTAMKKILMSMNLSKASVFLDLGCGVGLPGIYAYLLFGCQTFGIDRDLELVQQAQKNVMETFPTVIQQAKCQFEMMDICNLTLEWLIQHKVTHLYAFDEVFTVDVFEYMQHTIEKDKLIKVIASTNPPKGHRGKLPWSNVKKEEEVIKIAGRMLGGTSCHTMYIYQMIQID